MVDLTDVTDDDDDDSGTILVPKVEVKDIPTEEVNEEHGTAQTAQYGLGHPQYGRGMRTRSTPVSYEPVMTGKTSQQGVNNLCYRGTRYTLNEVVPFGDTPYKMGVVNLNIDTPVQVQAPDEGWEDNDSLTEHLFCVMLVQQYNLKKGLELFGDRAEAATTKELQHQRAQLH